MKAWIIKWNWIGEHAAIEQPLVSILSARTRPETVRKHVEFLYTATHCSLREQIDQARYINPAQPAYPAEFNRINGVLFQGRITCGHNPFLEAFQVDNLRLIVGDNGEESLDFHAFARKRPA